MREYTLSSWTGTYVRSSSMQGGERVKEKGAKERQRMGYNWKQKRGPEAFAGTNKRDEPRQSVARSLLRKTTLIPITRERECGNGEPGEVPHRAKEQ